MRHDETYFTLREVIYIAADLQRELDDVRKERDDERDSFNSASTRAHRAEQKLEGAEGMLEQVKEERDGLLSEKSALTGRVLELQEIATKAGLSVARKKRRRS